MLQFIAIARNSRARRSCDSSYSYGSENNYIESLLSNYLEKYMMARSLKLVPCAVFNAMALLFYHRLIDVKTYPKTAVVSWLELLPFHGSICCRSAHFGPLTTLSGMNMISLFHINNFS